MLLDTQDGFGQFRLAIALDTGDGENLTLGDVEADSVHHIGAVRRAHCQVFHHERGFLRLRGSFVQAQAHRAPNHHGRQFRG